jgi:hypothetical protein
VIPAFADPGLKTLLAAHGGIINARPLDQPAKSVARHYRCVAQTKLLSSAEQVRVKAAWARRTWPRRRYLQQCYAKTVKYTVEHPEISGCPRPSS